MNEAQRFLRYLIPGILFVGEVALLLWIVDPCIFAGLMDNNSNFLALVATTLVVSGGVGYFLSLCHHFLSFFALSISFQANFSATSVAISAHSHSR